MVIIMMKLELVDMVRVCLVSNNLSTLCMTLGSRCAYMPQQQENPEEFTRWIIEELRTMSSRHHPFDSSTGAERGRAQYGDRVDGCTTTACNSMFCKHRQEKSPIQQFLPPPASPRQRQPSPSARMSATAPSPCPSAGPSQSTSPWTPVTPRKRKRGNIATSK